MAILELLAGTFPAAFVLLETRRRPLKMGIAADAMAALPDVKRHLLNGALGRYTRARPYLTKLVEGAERIDLAGKVVGFVTAAEAAERLSPRATLARAA